MKKRAISCIAILILVCAVLALLVALYGLPKQRAHPVDMYDLLVDTSVFPPGWRVEIEPRHPPPGKHIRKETESVYVQFVDKDSSIQAVHLVCRYRNNLQASISMFAEDEFPNRDQTLTPWSAPEEWTYESPIAKRFEFACAELDILGVGRLQSCKAIAQYDEYVSVFRTHMSPEYMTLEDLESILKTIDERMVQYLTEE